MTRLRPIGEIDSTRRFDLAIGLPLRNREALTNLLDELYDPASPNYHKFLTPEQFTAQFGPTEDDYLAVISFVKSNHFVLMGRHPNRLLVDVNGAHPNLMPDLSASLDVTLTRTPGAIVVPRDAIRQTGDRTVVRVQRGSGFEDRVVTVAALNAHEAMIGSGLDDGAVVARNVSATTGHTQ